VIIVDLNQVMISTLMVQIGNHKNIKIEEDIVRHMVLNSLRGHKVKFSPEYGEMIIACDDKNYWRKEVYPYYKANRKKEREASELDWNSVFEVLNKIRQELKDNFPYKVIQVEHAEADDIIATLVKEFSYQEKILILSGDKDFGQLQKYPSVKQYSPVLKKYIICTNPELFLKEHIMRGDSGDGIPNFLSPDNSFVMGIRQSPVTSKKLANWVLQEPEQFCNETMLRNYKRNQQLIDLEYIPAVIADDVLEQYHSQKKDRSKLFNYFVSHKLKNLMEAIGDF
jgi:5'-3' exonuclease, N-terminal resolvase-like domain/T4 RNase H, C terminal